MTISADHSRFRFLRQGVLVMTLCVGFCAPALAADADRAPESDASGGGSEAQSQAKCVHGCERWGRVCNVDPRGDYKCRRRCEKFGKICE